MKKSILISFLIGAIILVTVEIVWNSKSAAALSQNVTAVYNVKIQQDSREQEVYTCPMHSEILQNQPGLCSKCGMNLIRKETSSDTESGGN